MVYAEEKNASETRLQKWQYEALLHFISGNDYLLSYEPLQALEHFQKGLLLLDQSDSSCRPIGFLITFSQAIAYDCLGFQDQCKQALGSLFLTISEYDTESNQVGSNNRVNEKSVIAIAFLENLAALAPSADIRALLLSLVDNLAEELFPPLQFDEHFSNENYAAFMGAQDDYYSIDLSKKRKSFWQKCKNWANEIKDWIILITEIFIAVKDAKDAYDDLRGSPQASSGYNGFENIDFSRIMS